MLNCQDEKKETKENSNTSRFKKFPLLLAEGRFKSRDKVNKPLPAR